MAKSRHRRSASKTDSGNGQTHKPLFNGQSQLRRAGESPAPGRDHEYRLILMGASAGGVGALTAILRSLPPTLPAAVFVVLHISPSGPSLLPEILNRAGHLPCVHAQDGMAISPGRVFIAPPDHHLLIKQGYMSITRGPRENSARPAVDPLFRTAARHYGPWVIGVVLSGGLDDGTLGLMDIKRFGGLTVVQDPQDAMFPSMPNSAVENVRVDYVLPLEEIGPVVTRLARTPVSEDEGAAFMAKIKDTGRPDIAEVGSDDLVTRNMNGPPSRFTCPECGGALWELENEKLLRYRCHIGHGYTAETLMSAQQEKLEDALWSALRALEENANMRRRMANRARRAGWQIMADNYDAQAGQAETRAGLIRSVLVEDKPKKISGNSAEAAEDKAIDAVDPTVGRRKAKQPPLPKTTVTEHSSANSPHLKSDKSGKIRRRVSRSARFKQ